METAVNQTRTSRSARNADRRENHQPQIEDISVVASEVATTLKKYAQERPDVVALWCFGIGFIVGWKLKPW